jgi:catechol 2,3-dioxygenase-like lactoylglutathione lyase family enzyme
MLQYAALVAFAATTDSRKAADFYGRILGLRIRYEDEFALSLDAAGVELRLQKVGELTPQSFTTLGWHVSDIADVLRGLAEQGVVPERYPWLSQDAAGIWRAPSGAAVAWFKDPDGNLLSVAQYPDS